MSLQIHEDQRIASRMNKNKYSLRHIIIKFQKIKGKRKKFLKQPKGKKKIYWK